VESRQAVWLCAAREPAVVKDKTGVVEQPPVRQGLTAHKKKKQMFVAKVLTSGCLS
jgi:hypothetical protein